MVAFDPEKAKQELDALGWRLNGQFREKDGRQLVIRDVLFDSLEHPAVRADRAEQPGPDRRQAGPGRQAGRGFFTDYVTVGNFDIAQFAWGGDAFPLCELTQIYRPTPRAISARSAAPRSTPRSKRPWKSWIPIRPARSPTSSTRSCAEGFSLPLTQSPGNVAVRSNLANFGAFGLADADYTKIGFMKP